MKKSAKNLTKAAMAVALASSALTPVVALAADSTAELSLAKVVVEIEGKLVTLDITTYAQALRAGIIDSSRVKYVQDSAGNVFDITQYSQGLRSTGSMSAAIAALVENNAVKEVTTVEGSINADGSIKFDGQTPEENSIETFFNNLAA